MATYAKPLFDVAVGDIDTALVIKVIDRNGSAPADNGSRPPPHRRGARVAEKRPYVISAK
jgi:hypothetical protein